MANRDTPRGFKPIGHLGGGEIRANRYPMTASKTIYPGDVVKFVAGGTVEPAAAADALACVGVAAEYKVSGASGTTWIMVYDDPKIIYSVQSQTGDTPAATDVASTGDHLATTGDTTLKDSRQELKIDGNGQFKIVGLLPVENNAWGEHAKLMVVFNEHLHNAAVAGV